MMSAVPSPLTSPTATRAPPMNGAGLMRFSSRSADRRTAGPGRRTVRWRRVRGIQRDQDDDAGMGTPDVRQMGRAGIMGTVLPLDRTTAAPYPSDKSPAERHLR